MLAGMSFPAGLVIATLGALAACGGGKAAAPTTASTTAGGQAAAALADPSSESLGGIALGDTAAAVEARLGPPDHKSEPEELGATGEIVSDWRWPAHGAVLSMALDASAAGGARVSAMIISAPSTLTTSRGVGIGTTRADVERIYQEYLGKGREPEEPDTTSAEQLIIGSVYGGTFFEFADGKVTKIFVGAGAE